MPITSPPPPPDFTVVLVALNEAATLPGLIDGLFRALAAAGATGEVVVADGGSTDGTRADVGRRLAREPRLRVVVAPTGYGRQLLAGFAAARGRDIVYMDGDGQYDPAELAVLLAGPAGRVVSARRGTDETGAGRRLLSRLYSAAAGLLTGVREPDFTSGFKRLPGDFARALTLRWGRSFLASTEIMIAAHRSGLPVVTVPVRCRRRAAGHSKLISRRGLAAVSADLLRLLFA